MGTKRNSFFDQKLFDEEVNEESKYILDDYTLEMRSRGLAVKTIEQYTSDIRNFLCWAVDGANGSEDSILEMNRRAFRRFFLLMGDNGSSPARINRMQCSLRGMLKFCLYDDEEYPEYQVNVMDRIDGIPNEPVRDIIFLTDEQVTFLIDYCVERGDYQMATFVSLCYDSAGRRGEIYQVEKHGFLEKNVTNEVVGKRGKRFTLLYLDRTIELATEYLKRRGEDSIDSLWTVQNAKGTVRQPSYEALYYWIIALRKPLEDEFGEKLDINPHSFRHTAIENYENGSHHSLEYLGHENIPLETLQILANHDDINTTQGYTKDRDQEELFKFFGVIDDGEDVEDILDM